MANNNEHIYTVTELTRELRASLEDMFAGLWIEGEISNFKIPASGHFYFSIKDENSMLKCVMFKNSGSRLKFTPENGMHVLCSGKIGVYEKQGQYQLYVDKIEPKGKGALHAAFEQLKNRLHKEGLFNDVHKKHLPSLPARVGVITSGTGAALRDILKVARRRFRNIEITICPVKVQGDSAAMEIAQAIMLMNEFNKRIAETDSGDAAIDSIIVGRGGGSMEDLWAFNEEVVARAIFDSDIPIVSAVGHEIDYTISDFVADRRAATPSAAAELLIPVKEELKDRVKMCGRNLETAIYSKLDIAETNLTNISGKYVLRDPMNVFLQLEQELDDIEKEINTKMKHCIEFKESGFIAVDGKLGVLSPLAILERGYSITFKDGNAIKDAGKLSAGDTIITRFACGEAVSRVEETNR